MAATGYSPIQLYYSTTASAAPTAGNLASGELAINITDGKLYYKDNAGAVQLLSTSTTANGTANGVLYLNGSKVATSGTALTFDGTNLGLGGSPVSSGVPGQPQLSVLSATSGRSGVINWQDTGNNNVATSYFFGSVFYLGPTTNHPFAFFANGSEAMRLTSTGLGIGTSSPVTKLHTSAYATISATFDRVGNYGQSLQFVRNGIAGNAGFGLIEQNQLGVYLDSAVVGAWTSTGLGIGTSSPSTKLEAAGVIRASSGTGQLNIGITGGIPYIQGYDSATAGNRQLAFYTNTEVMRLDSSGNLGLGVTPSAWSGVKAIDIGTSTALYAAGAGQPILANNFYLGSGGNTYKTTGGATAYQQLGSQHQWFNAPSGTAGNAITFTQAMTLDASGRLGIGTTSPGAKVEIGVTADSSNSVLTRGYSSGFQGDGTGLTSFILATNNSGSTLSGYGIANGVIGLHVAGAVPLTFGTNGTERARIDSSGNLGIGTSSPGAKLDIGSGALRIKNASGDTSGLLIYQAASDTSTILNYYSGPMVFGTGNTERMRLDSSGNLGLGVTPSAWSASPFRVQQIGTGIGTAFVAGRTDSSNSAFFGVNAFYGGTDWVRIGASYATRYYQAAGSHIWDTTGSSTAGSTITWTQAMTLDASGNLSIGTTSTDARASVWTTDNTAYSSTSAGNLLQLRNGSTTSGVYSGINFVVVGNGADVGTANINAVHTASGSAALTFSTRNSATTAERARIDSSGNLGIGTSSPAARLVSAGSSATNFKALILRNGDGTTGSSASIDFEASTGTSGDEAAMAGRIAGLRTGSGTSGALTFSTTNGGTLAERARIDSSGNLLCGATTNPVGAGAKLTAVHTGAYYAGSFVNDNKDYQTILVWNKGTTGTRYLMEFGTTATYSAKGSITTDGTNTAYNTSSDYRLKNITGPISNSGSYIDSLNPVEGTWKENGSVFVGLIAHEVQEVSRTSIVTGEKDGEKMQSMDYSSAEIIANLIAEVKSLRARVAQLESN